MQGFPSYSMNHFIKGRLMQKGRQFTYKIPRTWFMLSIFSGDYKSLKTV